MKIAIGADHRGFKQKTIILSALAQEADVACIDVGTETSERTDYPIYAQAVVRLMLNGEAQLGILLCGSGAGIAIAANRYTGIYAGVAWLAEVAAVIKEHDNVNVLVIPSDYVSDEQVMPIVKAWLQARFKEGRYAERLCMIDAPV